MVRRVPGMLDSRFVRGWAWFQSKVGVALQDFHVDRKLDWLGWSELNVRLEWRPSKEDQRS